MKKNKVLVTGSAGFLGGSMCFELLKNNHEVVGLDSYQNSNQTATKKIKDIFKDSFKFLSSLILKISFLFFSINSIPSLVSGEGIGLIWPV